MHSFLALIAGAKANVIDTPQTDKPPTKSAASFDGIFIFLARNQMIMVEDYGLTLKANQPLGALSVIFSAT